MSFSANERKKSNSSLKQKDLKKDNLADSKTDQTRLNRLKHLSLFKSHHAEYNLKSQQEIDPFDVMLLHLYLHSRDLDKAHDLLHRKPFLLLARSNSIDRSLRMFFKCTAFELAKWMLDIEMISMLWGHFKVLADQEKDLDIQAIALKQWNNKVRYKMIPKSKSALVATHLVATHSEQHYSFNELIETCSHFNRTYEACLDDVPDYIDSKFEHSFHFAVNEIGRMERRIPMWLAMVIGYGLEKALPIIQKEGILFFFNIFEFIKLRDGVTEIYPLDVNPQNRLGFHFLVGPCGYIGAQNGRGALFPSLISMEPLLVELEKMITTELKQFVETELTHKPNVTIEATSSPRLK